MKTKYERPVINFNESTSEGVYMASGAVAGDGNADCWTVDPYSVQDWNGSHHVFEIKCVHSSQVEHISTASTVVLTFSSPLTDAYAESNFTCTFAGNTATIVRTLHANAYKSGDVVTYKVWAKASDEATTKALRCIGAEASISCTKSVNVQGRGGDGN